MIVTLILVLGLMNQKPTQIALPMTDVAACLAEASRFLAMEAAEGAPKIVLKVAACKMGVEGMDAKQGPKE